MGDTAEMAAELRQEAGILQAKAAKLIEAAVLLESVSGNTFLQETIALPEKYNAALTWEEKCLFILNEYGPLLASGVAEKAIELNPTTRLQTAQQRSIYCLSKLKNEGVITVSAKIGRKFIYCIKPKP